MTRTTVGTPTLGADYHLARHSELHGIPCGLCGHAARSMSVYATHLTVMHTHQISWQSAYCQRVFEVNHGS